MDTGTGCSPRLWPSCFEQGDVTRWSPEVPSSLNYSVILWFYENRGNYLCFLVKWGYMRQSHVLTLSFYVIITSNSPDFSYSLGSSFQSKSQKDCVFSHSQTWTQNESNQPTTKKKTKTQTTPQTDFCLSFRIHLTDWRFLMQAMKVRPLYVVDNLLAPGKISAMLLMTNCQVIVYYFFLHWVIIIPFAGYVGGCPF